MNSRRWQDQFQEAARTSELSYADSGSASALFYALDQKLMSETDYFAWAQEVFELPVLRMSFFSDHQADPTVWQKWKKHYTWQSDCLPLSEWDGILYVACLEPKEFPENIKAVCLLTPPAGLKQMWMNYQSQTAFELQDVETPISQNSEEASMLADLFEPPAGLGAPQAAPISQPAATASPLVNLEALAPADLNATTPKELELTAPKELNLTAPKDLDLNVLELDPIVPAASAAAAASTLLTPLEPKASPILESILNESPLAPEVKTPAPAVKPAAAVAKKASAPAPQRAIPQIISTSIYFLDTVLKKDKTPLNGPQIFAQMKTHFEKSLLLAVDTLEKSAKVLLWDDNFQAPPALNEIILTEPSFFRIATTTQRPYHGMVIQNAINDQFFTEWNDSKIPDHITVVPVVIQDHVVGLLIGFAQAEAFNRNVLQFAEKLAADLSLQIEGAQAKAA